LINKKRASGFAGLTQRNEENEKEEGGEAKSMAQQQLKTYFRKI
jgi:hypothetical protein